MSKRLTIAIACAAIAAISVSAADLSVSAPNSGDRSSYPNSVVVPNVLPHSSRTLMSQAYGTRCASSAGICPIPPAPIGFYCQCGTYPGAVIQ